jgi:hypothetical protein
VHDSSIEGYIAEKLQHFRRAMAQAMFEDLLANAFKVVETPDAVTDTHRSEAMSSSPSSRGETLRASSATPVPIKSFSFV